MKNKNTLIFLPLAVGFLVLEGCADITGVTVLKTAPPYAGEVEIRLAPDSSSAPVLFEMKTNSSLQLPSDDILDKMKQEGAKLGANVLVFNCGAFGTVGEELCVARGHRE
jgi:hypothetical protein